MGKTLFLDLFKFYDVKSTDLMENKRMMVFTAHGDKTILFRHYEIENPDDYRVQFAYNLNLLRNLKN